MRGLSSPLLEIICIICSDSSQTDVVLGRLKEQNLFTQITIRKEYRIIKWWLGNRLRHFCTSCHNQLLPVGFEFLLTKHFQKCIQIVCRCCITNSVAYFLKVLSCGPISSPFMPVSPKICTHQCPFPKLQIAISMSLTTPGCHNEGAYFIWIFIQAQRNGLILHTNN